MKKVFLDKNGKIKMMAQDVPGITIRRIGYEEAYFPNEALKNKKVGDTLSKETRKHRLTREQISNTIEEKTK
jgi:hypothetical protein